MATIIKNITNNLPYSFTLPIPGFNTVQPPVIITGYVVNMDLSLLTTEDTLWALQSVLNSLVASGAITVTGTINTSSFNSLTNGGTITGALGIGETPDSSAALDVSSTTQGFLPPRMTTIQKYAIISPSVGLFVYDLSLHKLSFWNGSIWETVSSS